MSQSTTQTARSRRGTLRAESMDLQQRNRRGTLRAESMDLQHCNVRDMSLVEILNAFSEAEYLELRGLFGEQLDVRLPAGEFVQLCTGLVLSKYPFLREEVLQPQAWELCRLTDASGHGLVDWDSLSSYLIESHMTGTDDIPTNPILGYNFVGTVEGRWHSSDEVCRHMVYIPVLRKVLAIVKSNNARLLTTGRGCRVERSLEVPGSILSADYNRMTETLTFATAENRFLVYKCSYISGTARLGELCLRRQMDLKSAQTVVRWGPQADRLYSGTKTGDVLAWRFYSQPRGLGVAKDLDLEVYRRWPGIHSDAVKDVLVLPGETRIVTCSLDTNVMELELERDFHVVHSAHKSGVHSLAYNDDFRLIFSAGFEYHVNCWVVGQAHSAPTRLEDPACPHAAPLLGVQVVPGTPQLLTVDAQGLAKVWDLRMLRAVHTFNVQRTEGTSAVSASGTQAQEVYHSFAFMPECQILCCNSNKDSYLYEYQGMEIQSEPLKVHGDLAPMVACELHEASATVVTAAGTDLALFDTRTGVMKRLMPAAIADDISCLHVNAAGSRLFAGTVAGHVVSVPLVSAVARRVYPAAPGEVVHIAALPVDRGNGLMTVTSGGVVTVWPDPDCVGSTKPVHRVALGYAVQSAGVSLSPAFLLVVDADGGWAALSLDGWRFTTLHRRSPAPDVPVVRLLPLAPAPAVCLAAVGGRLEVWGLSPSPFGDMVIAAWDSTPAEVALGPAWQDGAPTVLALAHGHFHDADLPDVLVTGDEAGWVRIWNIRDVACAAHPAGVGDGAALNGSGGDWARQSYVSQASSAIAGGGAREPYDGWRAHDDALLSLALAQGARTLITCGMDHRVTVWGITEALRHVRLGSLRRCVLAADEPYAFALPPQEPSVRSARGHDSPPPADPPESAPTAPALPPTDAVEPPGPVEPVPLPSPAAFGPGRAAVVIADTATDLPPGRRASLSNFRADSRQWSPPAGDGMRRPRSAGPRFGFQPLKAAPDPDTMRRAGELAQGGGARGKWKARRKRDASRGFTYTTRKLEHPNPRYEGGVRYAIVDPLAWDHVPPQPLKITDPRVEIPPPERPASAASATPENRPAVGRPRPRALKGTLKGPVAGRGEAVVNVRFNDPKPRPRRGLVGVAASVPPTAGALPSAAGPSDPRSVCLDVAASPRHTPAGSEDEELHPGLAGAGADAVQTSPRKRVRVATCAGEPRPEGKTEAEAEGETDAGPRHGLQPRAEPEMEAGTEAKREPAAGPGTEATQGSDAGPGKGLVARMRRQGAAEATISIASGHSPSVGRCPAVPRPRTLRSAAVPQPLALLTMEDDGSVGVPCGRVTVHTTSYAVAPAPSPTPSEAGSDAAAAFSACAAAYLGFLGLLCAAAAAASAVAAAAAASAGPATVAVTSPDSDLPAPSGAGRRRTRLRVRPRAPRIVKVPTAAVRPSTSPVTGSPPSLATMRVPVRRASESVPTPSTSPATSPPRAGGHAFPPAPATPGPTTAGDTSDAVSVPPAPAAEDDVDAGAEFIVRNFPARPHFRAAPGPGAPAEHGSAKPGLRRDAATPGAGAGEPTAVVGMQIGTDRAPADADPWAPAPQAQARAWAKGRHPVNFGSASTVNARRKRRAHLRQTADRPLSVSLGSGGAVAPGGWPAQMVLDSNGGHRLQLLDSRVSASSLCTGPWS